MNDFVDDYDEYDELYGGREKITKKNAKTKMKKTFNNHNGCCWLERG